MKVAIYIAQGVTQLVLTPEGEWEADVIAKMLPSGDSKLSVYRGSFYECRGGWFRYGMEQDDSSLIMRVDPVPPPESPTEVFPGSPAPERET